MARATQQIAVIADVAAMAGVSSMTVSRALSGRGQVSSLTRARVLEAAATLNYRPNVAAQMLSSGRSRTIGVVTLEGSVNGPTSTLAGIEQQARSIGYAVSVAILSELTPVSIADAVDSLRAISVGGIILSAPHTEINDSLLPPSDIPMVAVEEFDGTIPVVAVDQHLGAVLATTHLIEAGHRVICHIAGPADRYEALRREDGWRSALRAAGLVDSPVLRGDWTAASGYGLGRQLVHIPDMSAVFVANDQMALGLLRALSEAGLAVPEQVSVVGFDDMPEAAYLTPSLTTVNYDFYELGRRTLQRLLDDVNGARARIRDPPARVLMKPTLVVRESSGPAPSRRGTPRKQTRRGTARGPGSGSASVRSDT